jgi:hypothetical protein
MRLWTLQSPDYLLTAGRVDHSRSMFFQDFETIKNAYLKLWNLIGEPAGQIIWCYTIDDIPCTGTAKRKWTLEVPEDKIICRINDCAWNIITEMTDQFRRDPGDTITDQLALQPVSGDWWDKIIDHDVMAHRYISALIRHPIQASWVVEDRLWQARLF